MNIEYIIDAYSTQINRSQMYCNERRIEIYVLQTLNDAHLLINFKCIYYMKTR